MLSLSPQTQQLLFKLHRWGGLILAAFILFYCVTGILLNHRNAFDYFTIKAHSRGRVEVSDTTALEAFLQQYKTRINRIAGGWGNAGVITHDQELNNA